MSATASAPTEAARQPKHAGAAGRGGRPLVRLSLRLKLSLGFVLTSVVGIGLAALLARAVTVREFESFFRDKSRAEFVAAAAAYYGAHQTWAGAEQALGEPPGAAGARSRPPLFALADAEGIVLLPAPPFVVGQGLSAAEVSAGAPIQVGGRRVGTVIAAARGPRLSDREAQFLASTNRALALAALGALATAALVGARLAQALTRPLADLTEALGAVARGGTPHDLPVRSADELGVLTEAFNRMTADLARQNQLRRQMTADIAHDLRTPLTVIAGYVEALREGVLPATPERFEAVHAELRHLTRLVDDLRTLSLADAGELPIHPRRLAPEEFVERMVTAYLPTAQGAGLTLERVVAAGLPPLQADPERLVQVLGNLLDNAIRHTPEGGRITLSVHAEGAAMAFEVRDDGEGITPEVLPLVFHRSYRGDPARGGENGSSGLGLSIANSIVRAHGGTLTARSAGLGRGSTFTVLLPLPEGASAAPSPDESVRRSVP